MHEVKMNCFRLFIICLIMSWAWTGCPAAAEAADSAALLAYGERDSQGKYRMHFTRYDGQAWSEPFPLSDGRNEEILPTIGSDDQGGIWVAWTELNGIFGSIRYSFNSTGAWSAPESLATATISDLAPSLAVDREGVAWLVFSGSDGIRDDIFSVRWLGNGWSRPEKIHPDNDTPDVLPQISIGSGGLPVVRWQGFDGGLYRMFSSNWTGSEWTAPKVEDIDRRRLAATRASAGPEGENEQMLNKLPPFLKDPSQAALHLEEGQTIHFRAGGR